MADEKPEQALGPGEVATANYGWTKPSVGASQDVWGGEWNTNLDGIDATVFGVQRANPNRLDNGDMYVDQHNAGASVAIPAAGTGAWGTDRWGALNTKAKFTIGQNYNGAPVCPGFKYFLGVQTTGGGAAPAAADQNFIVQSIEYDAFGDFGWGTANAQPATLSFWVYSSLTGNFSVCLQGQVSPYRVFVTTYNIPTANTWTKITINIPADTTVSATNWTGAGNAAGLAVLFDLGTGATNQTSTNLGVWQNSTTAIAASGAVKLVATSNAKLAITGVKLELGSVATPWVNEPLATKLARCQRYYQYLPQSGASGYNLTGNALYGIMPFLVQMRAAPTITFSGISYLNASALTTSGIYTQNASAQAVVTASGTAIANAAASISAEI